MITGVMFDISEPSLTASLAQLTGVALIVIGVYTSHRVSKSEKKAAGLFFRKSEEVTRKSGNSH